MLGPLDLDLLRYYGSLDVPPALRWTALKGRTDMYYGDSNCSDAPLSPNLACSTDGSCSIDAWCIGDSLCYGDSGCIGDLSCWGDSGCSSDGFCTNDSNC